MSFTRTIGVLLGISLLAVAQAEPQAGFAGHQHPRGEAHAIDKAHAGRKGHSRDKGPPVQYGASVAHGNGSFTPFGVVIAGVPRAIGVRFPASTLTGQPTAPSDGTWDIRDEDGNVLWYCCGHERVLEVPDNLLDDTPFKHIVVNWNPHGHIPVGVFNVPHFDFHFYTITEEQRTSIAAPAASERCIVGGEPVPVDCATLARLTAALPADQMPPDYIRPGAVEPGMGDHLLDPFGSGLNGNPFDHTFIFGAYEGNLSFFEPMITVEYLQTKPKQCFPIRLPAALPEAGWAPSQYCIEYQRGRDVFTVSLESFVYLTASSR